MHTPPSFFTWLLGMLTKFCSGDDDTPRYCESKQRIVECIGKLAEVNFILSRAENEGHKNKMDELELLINLLYPVLKAAKSCDMSAKKILNKLARDRIDARIIVFAIFYPSRVHTLPPGGYFLMYIDEERKTYLKALINACADETDEEFILKCSVKSTVWYCNNAENAYKFVTMLLSVSSLVFFKVAHIIFDVIISFQSDEISLSVLAAYFGTLIKISEERNPSLVLGTAQLWEDRINNKMMQLRTLPDFPLSLCDAIHSLYLNLNEDQFKAFFCKLHSSLLPIEKQQIQWEIKERKIKDIIWFKIGARITTIVCVIHFKQVLSDMVRSLSRMPLSQILSPAGLDMERGIRDLLIIHYSHISLPSSPPAKLPLSQILSPAGLGVEGEIRDLLRIHCSLISLPSSPPAKLPGPFCYESFKLIAELKFLLQCAKPIMHELLNPLFVLLPQTDIQSALRCQQALRTMPSYKRYFHNILYSQPHVVVKKTKYHRHHLFEKPSNSASTSKSVGTR